MMDEAKQQDGKSAGTVLLVDDDKFLLDMYVMKFQQANFSAHAYLSAQTALKALREGLSPDVILFDLVMPEMSGFALLEALRKEKLAPASLRIALTNEMNDDEKTKAKELGASDYIVKATMIPSEVVEKVLEELKTKK